MKLPIKHSFKEELEDDEIIEIPINTDVIVLEENDIFINDSTRYYEIE
jgi:hypothetical protein